MPTVKVNELRNLGKAELENKLHTLKEQLYQLRFKAKIGQLEKPSMIGQTKRQIAQIHTILNEETRNNEKKQ